jgi:hypothetical protein
LLGSSLCIYCTLECSSWGECIVMPTDLLSSYMLLMQGFWYSTKILWHSRIHNTFLFSE